MSALFPSRHLCHILKNQSQAPKRASKRLITATSTSSSLPSPKVEVMQVSKPSSSSTGTSGAPQHFYPEPTTSAIAS
ncbi:hypothetical protein SAY87_009758 [Trapa incisa]|uniref:Uncharacterized protein n=1 Tax=Trapa incisa TaxID=236973 RepID=A0AAN7PY60_9MYRT|nr:hypothetical protein SAY87_009758 [Trapa incisa]